MHLDDRVLFVHCPRTSGTGIRRSLLFGVNPNLTPQWPKHLGKHAFAKQLQAEVAPEVWSSRFKFSIVRNPWDRLVSLYGLFRRQLEEKHQSKRARYPIKVDKIVSAVASRDIAMDSAKPKKIAFVECALHLRFLDWVKWCDEHQWQACPYLGTRPMTRIPQSRWFDGLDAVFRFEDRDAIDSMLQAQGYPPSCLENETRRSPWQSYYDSETYDLVAKTYAEDIESFGY